MPTSPDFLDKDHLFLPVSSHLYCQCFTRSVRVDFDFPLHSVRLPLIDQFVEGFHHSFWLLSEISNLSGKLPQKIHASCLQVPSWSYLAFLLWKSLERVKLVWLEISTLLYYLLGSIGFLSVFRACMPFTFWRVLLIVWSVELLATALFLRIQKLLEISTLTRTNITCCNCHDVSLYRDFHPDQSLQAKKWRLQSVDCSFYYDGSIVDLMCQGLHLLSISEQSDSQSAWIEVIDSNICS